MTPPFSISMVAMILSLFMSLSPWFSFGLSVPLLLQPTVVAASASAAARTMQSSRVEIFFINTVSFLFVYGVVLRS